MQIKDKAVYSTDGAELNWHIIKFLESKDPCSIYLAMPASFYQDVKNIKPPQVVRWCNNVYRYYKEENFIPTRTE